MADPQRTRFSEWFPRKVDPRSGQPIRWEMVDFVAEKNGIVHFRLREMTDDPGSDEDDSVTEVDD